jgi:SAM-dependent methyltransferase
VGSGDGRIAAEIMARRPRLEVEGVDVKLRPKTAIPTTAFDGIHLPQGEGEFDVVLMVDVLHHTSDPGRLLREAIRVAASCVVIKDHYRKGFAAGTTLRFMDWVGNRAHGVVLPYHYLSPDDWADEFARSGLVIDGLRDQLHLYPRPWTWIFDRSLHFVARLRSAQRQAVNGCRELSGEGMPD